MIKEKQTIFRTEIRSFALCLILLLVLTFLTFTSKQVYAQDTVVPQEQNQICTAVDLVIVIDQSGSMLDTNDKNGRRFDAAKTIANYLGNHAAWLCPGQNIRHRVAVVGFGDRSVYVEDGQGEDNPYQEDIATYLPPTTIPQQGDFASDKELREAWKTYRDETIAPLIYSGKGDNLNATDHRSGLLGARDILQQWSNDPLPGVRRKAVIMITDGEPCLFWRGCDNLPPGTNYNIRPDLTLIGDLTNQNGNDFPFRGDSNPDSVFISVLLLSQRSQNFTQSFLDAWTDIATSHGGTLREARSAPRLSPLIAEMLQPIVQSGLQSVTCGKSFWITPYANNLTFLYAFALVDDESIDVKIHILQDGNEVEVQRGQASSSEVKIIDYVVDGQNESYVFAPPIPGEYRLEVSGQVNCADILDVKIESLPVLGQVVFPNVNSVYPATPQHPFYNEQIADKFYVTVTDNNGNSLQEFAGYPLLFEAVVTSTDGTHEQRLTSADFIKIKDGVYESKSLIQTPLPGGYDWELVATVKHPDPTAQPLTVFSDRGSFIANEVAMFGFSLEQPVEGSVLPLNTVQGSKQNPLPIPILVNMLDENGDPLVNRLDILPELREVFEARLYQGSKLIETIQLQIKPGSTHQFVGEFTNAQANNILNSGTYTIDVVALWDRDDYNVLNYAPFNKLQSINFSQYEVIPLSAIIVSPQTTLTLHEDDWRTNMLQGGELKPFDFYVEIMNAVTGEIVPLETALANPTSTIQAAIVPPSGNPELVSLTPLANENFQRLLGENVGTDIPEEGEYQIKLQTDGLSLNEGYAWTAPEQSASFSRQDTVRTTPSTWRTIGLVLLTLFIGLVLITVYFWINGPTGKLAIVTTGTYGNQQIEAGPWRLSWMPRKNRVRHNWLRGHDIKYLVVKKTSPLDPNYRRAVHVVAIDKQGRPVYDSVLHPDSPETFVADEIVYM